MQQVWVYARLRSRTLAWERAWQLRLLSILVRRKLVEVCAQQNNKLRMGYLDLGSRLLDDLRDDANDRTGRSPVRVAAFVDSIKKMIR
jgi:hypothetical protein